MILLISVLSIFNFSCHPKSKNEFTKKSLKINLTEEPATMDPRKGGDIYSSALHFLLFEGLTKISETSSCDYGLAYKIDLSEDKLTYTFHLRDALWSNKTPITAYDFEYSWKSMLDPSFPCPNANLLYFILNAEEAKRGEKSLESIGVRALDNKTLQVTLKSPTPYFLNLISFCVFFPVCKNIVENNPKWAEDTGPNFVSNGPYELSSWKCNNQIIVKKNPHFWDKDNINLKQIDISFIADENTALEMFANNELDILGSPYTNIPIDASDDLIKKEYLKAFPVGKTFFCSFNVEHPILSNTNIRKALSLSLDRQAIVKAVGILNEIPAINFVPPVLKQGKNTEYIKEVDIQKANEYLKLGLQELGLSHKDLGNLSLTYTNQKIPHRICQIIQQQWLQNLGINVSLESCDSKIFLEKLNTGNFIISQHYWVAQYDDSMNILDRFRKKSNPKNYSNWENQDYIDFLDLSAFKLGKERDVLLEKAEALIMEEMPIAPIFHASSIRMIQPYVKGIYTSSIGSVHLEKISFKTDEKTDKNSLKNY